MSNIVHDKTGQVNENMEAVATVAVHPDRCSNEPNLMPVYTAPALGSDMAELRDGGSGGVGGEKRQLR
jgi:hypothetical protein